MSNNQEIKQIVFFCVDQSGSMASDMKGHSAIEVVKELIRGFTDLAEDEKIPTLYALSSFGSHVYHHLDFIDSATDLYNAVANLRPGGATALFKAVAEAANRIISIESKHPNATKRIFILSDGGDNNETPDLMVLQKKLIDHKIRVDNLALGEHEDRNLKELFVEKTGGRLIHINSYNEGVRALKENHLYQP